MKKKPRLRPEKEGKNMQPDCSKKVSSPGIMDRILLAVSTAASSLFLSTGTTFAAEDLISKASSLLKESYLAFAGLDTGIAALAAVICIISMQISTSENKLQRRKDHLVRIAVCWAVILCLGTIIAYGKDFFDGMGYQG